MAMVHRTIFHGTFFDWSVPAPVHASCLDLTMAWLYMISLPFMRLIAFGSVLSPDAGGKVDDHAALFNTNRHSLVTNHNIRNLLINRMARASFKHQYG